MPGQPFMQFFVGDWQKSADVQSLPYSERGIWFEMLCFMHNSHQRGELVHSTGTAMADDEVARLLGLSKQDFTNSLNTLLRTGVTERNHDGALINRRMVREREKKEAKSRAGKLGAIAKHDGTDLTEPLAYIQQLYDSDSDSGICNWGSDPDQEKEKFKAAWAEWQAYRIGLGDVVKDWPRMWRKQLNFVARYPIAAACEILEQSIRNNWQGLFAPKSNTSRGVPANPTPLYAKVKAVEAQIADVDRELRGITSSAPSVFPERAADEERRRQPLRAKKAQLNAQLRTLRAKQSE